MQATRGVRFRVGTVATVSVFAALAGAHNFREAGSGARTCRRRYLRWPDALPDLAHEWIVTKIKSRSAAGSHAEAADPRGMGGRRIPEVWGVGA